MIYLIGEAPQSLKYQSGTFERFRNWIEPKSQFQFDIETDMQDDVDRTILSLGFGSADFEDSDQWVLQIGHLTPEQLTFIYGLLTDRTRIKILQNASFEIRAFRRIGIRLRGIYDTMLAEKIIYCGYDTLEYNLEDILIRRMGIFMDKSLQTSFTSDKFMSEGQVLYAAFDVKYLAVIMREQKLWLHQLNLEWVAGLEFDAVIGFAEIMYQGMKLDTEKWMDNSGG
jgi:ribonuclease D